MSEPDVLRSPSRRAVLAATGGAILGATAGAAGGAVLASTSLPAPVQLDGLKRFQDKVVAITGATSGIGRAAALAFAREGASVAFCGRRTNFGAEVQEQIRQAGGKSLYVEADVRDEEAVASFIGRAVETFGGLDIALNNAGITIEKKLHEFTMAEWDDVVNTNLRGVFFAIKYEVPHLIARGGGQILVTSSSVANYTATGRSVYTATKAGLVALVRAAALDYADNGIRVNAILPGTTDTALVRRVAGMQAVPDAVWEVGAAQWGRSHVRGLGRMATAEEIGAFAVAMASPELTYLTGAALNADGGMGVG